MHESIEEYTWCSTYFEYHQSKIQTGCSPENSPLCGIQPEQLSPIHPPPKSSRTPQEEPHFVALSIRATSLLLLRSLSTTLEQIALREILLLEETQG
jgi:hypothetical protein